VVSKVGGERWRALGESLLFLVGFGDSVFAIDDEIYGEGIAVFHRAFARSVILRKTAAVLPCEPLVSIGQVTSGNEDPLTEWHSIRIELLRAPGSQMWVDSITY
jgi:hypothetical protein